MKTLSDFNLEKLSSSELGEILIEAKKAYYTSGKPIMDDHTYDTLEAILLQKSPHHRLFSKIGNPNFDTGWGKKTHIMPMGSQNKVTNFSDLAHYFQLKKINIPEFIIQPKCDGLSVELVYKNGQFVEAITRGDGQVGDVVTQNVVKMQSFVAKIKNFTGSIRCEIVVTKDDFKKLPPDYSNPRNAASGLTQRLDSKYSELCSLVAVDIFPNLKTISDELKFMKQSGFYVVESFVCTEFVQIENIFQEFLTTKRINYPFDIDGLVIKINDQEIAQNLGVKDNRPKHQVAYKFPADSNQTTIKNVTWQVGPMGAITPVAQVEPITLSGAIITFASLANHSLIIKNDFNLGDIVEISRRGDVIPHIEKVITKVNTGHIDIPRYCPSCKTALIIEDKLLRCPNSQNCLPQIIGSLNLFCQTLEILGLSEKTITKLYSANKVKTPGDFFKLDISDIAPLDNLGEKSAKNIIHQIQLKKILTLVEVFDSAIIPHFSKARIIQLIEAGFDTPHHLLNLTTDQLLGIKGFKITLAQKIVDGINLRRSWIESILANVKLRSDELRSDKLNNQVFCITGDLSQPRKNIENLILQNGGKLASSVSKNTSYLLTNETSSNSSKFTQAKALNIPIINEESFNKLINS